MNLQADLFEELNEVQYIHKALSNTTLTYATSSGTTYPQIVSQAFDSSATTYQPRVTAKSTFVTSIDSANVSTWLTANPDSRMHEHYLAEWLYQNPGVCEFDHDRVNQIITALPDPVMTNPVSFPAPSGGDDTAAIEAILNANSGSHFDGGGLTYIIDQVDIDVPGFIFNATFTPFTSADRFFDVNVSDVKFHNCHLDGQDQGSVRFGCFLGNNADNFRFTGGSVKNFNCTSGENGSAFYWSAATSYYIGCNVLHSLYNSSGTGGTHRMNPFWGNGGSANVSSGGGLIFSNDILDVQSNGTLDDADCITLQSFGGSTAPVRFYANRAVDPGKRFAKLQSSEEVFILSNEMKWSKVSLNLGNASRLHGVSVQPFSEGKVIVNNNRFATEGADNWGMMFSVNYRNSSDAAASGYLDFEANDLRIDNLQTGTVTSDRSVIKVTTDGAGTGSATDGEVPVCTFADNYVYGAGDVAHAIWAGNGWDVSTGTTDFSGIIWEVPITSGGSFELTSGE